MVTKLENSMTTQKNLTPKVESEVKQPVNARANYNNTTSSQRIRLLRALRIEPITTLQARQQLAICSPAPRIGELRAMGHTIDTTWSTDVDSTGTPHRVGLYTLLQEAKAT